MSSVSFTCKMRQQVLCREHGKVCMSKGPGQSLGASLRRLLPLPRVPDTPASNTNTTLPSALHPRLPGQAQAHLAVCLQLTTCPRASPSPSLASVSPTCKIRLLGLEHLKDPLLSRHLNVPVSQSHSCNYHSFNPRLMPAECKAGWSCRAKAPDHQPWVLPKSWGFTEPDGGDGTWGRR